MQEAAVHQEAKSGSESDPLDQVDFVLDEQQSEKFTDLLADPPAPTQKLKDLMDRKAPWED
jgi:uncharacterized protein (DUF1778 family)